MEWDLSPEAPVYEHWQGADDGRVHPPLRAVFIGPAVGDPRPRQGTLWIDEVVVETPLTEEQVVEEQRMWYRNNPGFRVTSPAPDFLFFPDEPVAFTLSVNPPPVPLELRVAGEITDVDGQAVATIPEQPLVRSGPVRASENGPPDGGTTNDERGRLTAGLRTGPPGRGYFEVRWTLREGTEVIQEARTCFAVIPENPQDHPRPESPFGVNVHFTQGWPTEIAALVQRTGIAWIRDHVSGPYDDAAGEYTGDDPTLLLAQAHHLCYLPLSPYYRPEDLAQQDGRWQNPAAARQVEAYVRRHQGRISHFELYNEPHGPWSAHFGGSWQGGEWVAPFVDFGKQQVPAVHRGDPDVVVLWPEIDLFLHTKLFVEAGAVPELQALAPHAYNLHKRNPYPEDQPFVRALPEVRAYLQERGVRGGIWCTEVGWTTYADPENQFTFYQPQTERQQAEKLVRMLVLQLYGGIDKVFWYDFYSDFDDPNHPEANFGLIRHRTFEPKPAVVAYANAIHWLSGATWIGRYATGGGGEGFAFVLRRTPEVLATSATTLATSAAASVVVVAWVQNGQTTEQWLVRSGVATVEVTDLYGRSHPLPVENGRLTLTLTESPVFVTGLTLEDVEAATVPRQ